MLHNMKIFFIVWSMGIEICLMGCVMMILLAHECLTVVALILGFAIGIAL